MSRMTRVIVLVALYGVIPEASGSTDRTFIFVSGQTSASTIYRFRSVLPGTVTPGTDFLCFESTVGIGLRGLGLRDAIVPEVGFGGGQSCPIQLAAGEPPVKRAWVNGNPAIEIATTFAQQWWVAVDGSSFQLLEPGVPFSANSVSFTLLEEGVGLPPATIAGAVPAVGNVGLAVLVIVLIVGGAGVVSRRKRAEAV